MGYRNETSKVTVSSFISSAALVQRILIYNKLSSRQTKRKGPCFRFQHYLIENHRKLSLTLICFACLI
jgi:hypothetical protein